MNTQLRHVVPLIVLLASIAFGGSVAAEERIACVASQDSVGFVESFSEKNAPPTCERATPVQPEKPTGCETVGPAIAQLGLSGHAGSGVAFAPACMTSFQFDLATGTPIQLPEPVSCESVQVHHPMMRRCP